MDGKEKKFIENDSRAREIATWDQLSQHAVAADELIERLREELAHTSRELAESRGEEETSGTWAIYKSFIAALELFGHDHVCVRARIELLVEAWQKTAAECERLSDADTAWEAAQARLVGICLRLGVDFCLEEPETCEQVIERMLAERAAMREALTAVLDLDTRDVAEARETGICQGGLTAGVALKVRSALATDAGKKDKKKERRENAESEVIAASLSHMMTGKSSTFKVWEGAVQRLQELLKGGE